MDRAYRRFLAAATTLAIPFLLMLGSFVRAESSQTTGGETKLAVAVDADDSVKGDEVIRQVVGKQLERGDTRPGLFQVLIGGDGETNGPSRGSGSNQSRGLLDTLFSGGSPSGNPSARSTSSNQNRSNGGEVDWSGIPYHQAKGSTTARAPAPIRDPNQLPASTSTRIIRGGSTRSVATPPRTRSTSTPTPAVTRRPLATSANGAVTTRSRGIPTPPAESVTTQRPTAALSDSSSSRRSNRRDVDSYSASASTSVATKSPKPEPPRQDKVVDLVPRVSRKQVTGSESDSSGLTNPEPKALAAGVTAEPASKLTDPEPTALAADVATTKPASKLTNPEPTALAADVATKPASKLTNPEPKALAAGVTKTTAIPASAKPEDAIVATEPETDRKIVAAVPNAKLSAPLSAETKTSASTPPGYTTPVDPATTRIPSVPGIRASSVPSQPYAASTPMANIPAASVSHRAGPPAAAFTPHPTTYPSMSPTVDDQNSDTKIGGAAIGSGVAMQDNFVPAQQSFAPSAAITHPYVEPPAKSVPAYETAQAMRDPFDDPYGRRESARHGYSGTSTMSTSGQPAPATAAIPVPRRGQETTTTMPSQSGAAPSSAIPMHAIDGYQRTPVSSTRTGSDRYDRPEGSSTNRMRTAAPQPSFSGGAGIVSSELPGIRVVTHGPDEVMIRQTNEYKIRVENRGSIDAEGLIVRAMIPDWAEVRGQNATRGEVDRQGEGSSERLVWTIDHLPAGTSEQLFVRLMAARSGTYDVDVDWTLIPQKSVARVKVHEPRLDLTIEGPEEVVYGKSQTYKVRVLNPGDGMAPNVVFTLSPNSATPQSQRIGDIPAGKEAQFDVELTAQDLGDLKIHGLAMGDLELRAEAAKTIRVAAAQIEAVLNGPELKYQNTEAMYNLQLQNVGSATSEKVIATLRIPTGVKYLGGIEDATVHAKTLKWEIPLLASGETREYQFRCEMAATGEHLFAFDCKGTAAGHADVALSTRVESIADLVLTINDPVAPAPIGSEVTYEIIVRNRGSREAKDVKAIAQFSHGIEPQRIEGQSGEVVTGQVLFNPIARIAAGEEVHLRIVAIAERAGHHRFRTEVRSGDTVLVAEEATHYMSPQSDRVSRRSTDAKQMK